MQPIKYAAKPEHEDQSGCGKQYSSTSAESTNDSKTLSSEVSGVSSGDGSTNKKASRKTGRGKTRCEMDVKWVRRCLQMVRLVIYDCINSDEEVTGFFL